MLFAEASFEGVMFWVYLWKALLILAVAGFAGMAVWVTIGGAVDIKHLFARIIAGHESEKEQQDAE
jgi:hypothetical protein